MEKVKDRGQTVIKHPPLSAPPISSAVTFSFFPFSFSPEFLLYFHIFPSSPVFLCLILFLRAFLSFSALFLGFYIQSFPIFLLILSQTHPRL